MPASLTDLFATSLDPLLVLGHDHRITLANEGMREVLGLAPVDLLGETFVSLVHPADREWIEASLLKLGRKVPRISFDGRVHHQDGGVRWMSWMFRRSPDGTVYASGRDESVRRQVERTVRRRERRRKAMLDHAADPLVVLDARGLIVDANASVASLFESDAHALLGQHVAELIPAFATSRPVHGVPFEARVETPNGPVDLEIRTNGFTFEDETMVVALARDIGKRKAHTEALASLSIRATLQNEAKSDFVAEMSHAMRTPLSAILGYSEMVLESESTANDDVQRIHSSAAWLLDLVDSALDLSRIESGALVLEQDDVDLTDLLADLENTLEPLQSGPFIAELEASPLQLITDRARLRQVLCNLLTHAARRSAGSSVRLCVRDTESDGRALVAFEVHDGGPGLTMDELQTAFQPFGSGGRGRDHVAGLGLSIAKKLTESLGGSLTAASNPAKGTVFTVFLPRGATPPS